MSKVKPQISTDQLIKRLHLMADTGGMLTRDRIEAVRQAADRLAVMRDMIATQQAADAWNAAQDTNVPQIIFNAMNNNHLFGGDEHEEH